MALNVRASMKDIASDVRNIESLREATISELFYQDTSNFFTIVPGIKGGQQVAALRGIEYITTSDPGCDNVGETVSIPSIDQTWEPKRQNISLKMCYTDYEASFLRWALGNGLDVRNLGDTEVYDFTRQFIINGMRLDMQRMALFSDEDIAAQDILADEAGKAKYYDTIPKGLIPTMIYFKTIPELSDKFVDLAKNEGANDAANLALADGYGRSIYKALTADRSLTNGQIMSSCTLADNYEDELIDHGGLQSGKDQMINGINALRYKGVDILPSVAYDKYRKNDFKADLGGGAFLTHLPHFALNAAKGNLQIGVDDVNALEDLRIEMPGGADDNVYIKGKYMMDFKMTDPYNFKAAL